MDEVDFRQSNCEVTEVWRPEEPTGFAFTAPWAHALPGKGTTAQDTSCESYDEQKLSSSQRTGVTLLRKRKVFAWLA